MMEIKYRLPMNNNIIYFVLLILLLFCQSSKSQSIHHLNKVSNKCVDIFSYSDNNHNPINTTTNKRYLNFLIKQLKQKWKFKHNGRNRQGLEKTDISIVSKTHDDLQYIIQATKSYSISDKLLIFERIYRSTIKVNKIKHALQLMSDHNGRQEYNLAHAINTDSEQTAIIEITIDQSQNNSVQIPNMQNSNVQIVSYNKFSSEWDKYDTDRNIPRVYERQMPTFFSQDSDSSAPYLAQCRATFIFNIETGKYLLFHSSLGIGQDFLEHIAQLGAGKKKAVIFGAWPGIHEAQLINTYLNIPVQVFNLYNATSHINVVYRANTKKITFFYANHRKNNYNTTSFKKEEIITHWLGTWNFWKDHE